MNVWWLFWNRVVYVGEGNFLGCGGLGKAKEEVSFKTKGEWLAQIDDSDKKMMEEGANKQ